MSDYRRVILPGGVYFFPVVTHDRIPLFHCDDRVEVLRRALRKVKAARPFQIDAMVVLPDHLHCIMPDEEILRRLLALNLERSGNAARVERPTKGHTIGDQSQEGSDT